MKAIRELCRDLMQNKKTQVTFLKEFRSTAKFFVFAGTINALDYTTQCSKIFLKKKVDSIASARQTWA
jgi:hypothetical protein